MSKVTVTVEFGDGRPSKAATMHADEAVNVVRELMFKVAVDNEFLAVYVTKAKVLKHLPVVDGPLERPAC